MLLPVLPVAAESPTPAPEDRTTSLTVSPAAGPDRTTVTLRGFSDCAVIDGHLVFTTYDGRADNVVVRSTSTTYDYAREKYPFTVRVVVPVQAAPGPAKAYAEPFCGPPEEYPPSAVLPFRVERSRLAVRISPRRPVGGDLLRVRAGTCDGPTGALTVRVRDGDRVTDRSARVDEDGLASVAVRLAAGGGRVEVSLPRAAAECRGSSYAGPLSAVVRPAGGTPAAPSPAPVPTPSALPSAPDSATASTSPSASAAVVAGARRTGSRGGGAGAAVPLAVLALVLAAGAVLALRRRARRG